MALIRKLEQDHATVLAEIDVPEGQIEVVTDIRLEGERLILYNFHIDGPGAGRLGPARLRQIAKDVMETYNVAVLEIHGFRRTTGAHPGHVPRPIRFARR